MSTLTDGKPHTIPRIQDAIAKPWAYEIRFCMCLGYSLVRISDDAISIMLSNKQATYLITYMQRRAMWNNGPKLP